MRHVIIVITLSLILCGCTEFKRAYVDWYDATYPTSKVEGVKSP